MSTASKKASERRYKQVAMLCAFSVVFIFAARVLAPLGGYDTLAYKVIYWFVVGLTAAAALAGITIVLGRAGLLRVAAAVMVALRWPRPASSLQFIVIVMTVTAVLATVPHYEWAVHASSGGTAPFSAVEVDVLQRVWRPVLLQMSRQATVGAVMALIATSWAFVGAVIALAWLRARRKATLSCLGVLATATIVVHLALWLLRTLSPLTLPW